MADAQKPLYMISVVADMLGVHPQTLRLYEREGFVSPSRTDGNTRLYSDEDIDLIRMILRLTRELGVNLAGVEVILSMREKMEQMQKELNQLIKFITAEMEKEYVGFSRKFEEALVRAPKSGLIFIEREDDVKFPGDSKEGV